MNPLDPVNFKEVAEVRTDSKNRISLGRKLLYKAKYYRVYEEQASGRILLEPLAIVPVSEPWLDKNPKAKAAVEEGLADAKAGRLVSAKSVFAKYRKNSVL